MSKLMSEASKQRWRNPADRMRMLAGLQKATAASVAVSKGSTRPTYSRTRPNYLRTARPIE